MDAVIFLVYQFLAANRLPATPFFYYKHCNMSEAWLSIQIDTAAGSKRMNVRLLWICSA